MKVMISRKLYDIYKKQHKNFDYAVTSVLDNLDPESYIECFRAVDSFDLNGEKCQIELGNVVSEQIMNDLKINTVDDKTAELLIWMGAVLPEV